MADDAASGALKIYGGEKDTNYFELSGGTYSTKPEASYIKPGYTVKGESAPFIVEKITADNVEDKVVIEDPEVTVSPDIDKAYCRNMKTIAESGCSPRI